MLAVSDSLLRSLQRLSGFPLLSDPDLQPVGPFAKYCIRQSITNVVEEPCAVRLLSESSFARTSRFRIIIEESVADVIQWDTPCECRSRFCISEKPQA